eukprot:6617-Heterococcus_DN1.PRE.2
MDYEEEPGVLEMPAAAAPHANSIPMCGYSVAFPPNKKPFPSQLAVMSKMLMAMRQSKNALLESPTGTGKTLALLCAALAYQRQQRIEIAAGLKGANAAAAAVAAGSAPAGAVAAAEQMKAQPVQLNYDDDPIDCTASSSGDETKPKKSSTTTSAATAAAAGSNSGAVRSPGSSNSDSEDSDDADFEQTAAQKRKRAQKAAAAAAAKGSSSCSDKHTAAAAVVKDEDNSDCCKGGASADATCNDGTGKAGSTSNATQSGKQSTAKKAKQQQQIPMQRPEKLPTIIFASRTHSQLHQVVGELRTCEGFLNHVAVNTVNPLLPPDIGSYAPAPFKMTLLSARSHTCVHQPAINHKAGVDEGCRAANKDRSCNMKRTAKNLSSQLPSVWDVEDIVQIGTVRRACPYFASKEALPDAQLVLCPYTYIVDPTIRRAMNLSLSNSIILFDEAHNLADICRASSSLKLSQTALADTSQEIIRLLSSDRVQPDIKPHYQLLHKAVSGIGSWLLTVSNKLTPKDFEREANTWTGEQALGILGYEADITAATVIELQSAVEAVAKEQEPDDNDAAAAAEDERQQRKATLSPPALTLVSQLVNVAVFMLGKESTNAQHYKMVVLREREANTNSSNDNSSSGSSS